MTSSNDGIIYVIPKANDRLETREQYALRIIEGIYDKDKTRKNANLINGCNIIRGEFKFVVLLDQAYKSFLLGLYYTTVSLSIMANERLCYDLIDKSDIIFNGIPLDSKQKEILYDVRFSKLVEFFADINLISAKAKSDILDLSYKRNNYVHPNFNADPEKDASSCLNKLLKIVDAVLTIL